VTALALLKSVRDSGQPFSWNLLPDGSMIVISVNGPKYNFDADQVKAAQAKPQRTNPQERGYKDPNLVADMQAPADKASTKTRGPEKDPPKGT